MFSLHALEKKVLNLKIFGILYEHVPTYLQPRQKWLGSKFVLVPIDKASNNIAFVCKRFYTQVLLEELGLIGASTSTAINNCSPNDIVQQHTAELKQMFNNIKVGDDMSTLPDIYWIPKLHKSPVKFRFIIASKQCTTKSLSKDVSSVFSLFQKQIATYHQKTHYFLGIKSYWIVNDRGSGT